ncbi:hypothetical protein [Flavobacterium sp. U410]
MKHKYFLKKLELIISEIENQLRRNEYKTEKYFKNHKLSFTWVYEYDFNPKRKYFESPKIYHALHPFIHSRKLKDSINENEAQEIIEHFYKNKKEAVSNIQLFKDEKQKKYYLFFEEHNQLNKEEAFYLYCSHNLFKEYKNIKFYIKQKVFSSKSKEQSEHFIQKSQYALESLSAKLINEVNPTSNNDFLELSNNLNNTECLKIAYIYVEKLLQFIEVEYQEFLNVNIKVPYRTILFHENKMAPKLEKVKSILLKLNIDQELLKTAYLPILRFSTLSIQDKITYQEFNYCCEYINELEVFCNNNSINEIEKKLHWWLLKLNYNDVNFFYWLTKKIKAEVKAEDTESKKINALYKCLKFVNQNQILISNRYNNKIPDIKQQITQWIEEEIEYRTKKVLYNSTNENIPNIINNKEKIHVGLSVAQLSWFVNLLVQSNIIKTKNQKDIIRFVADNFQTDNQKEISPTSLYSKYYNVESSTKETMKLKLIDLLNRTK